MIKKFEGFITSIKKDIAFATLIDKDGEKSYVEIELKELKENNIECRAGTIFSFILSRKNKLEEVKIDPIKGTPITKKEFDKLQKEYEEKYGDV